MKTLTVSRATAGFLQRGHPWVRPDRFTRGLEKLGVGEAVTLIDQQGKPLASALADPQAEICARVFHRKPDALFDPAAAVARAWTRRAALHSDPDTDCYRVIHGEADYLPGIRVERYGSAAVVLILAHCAMPHASAVCAAIAQHLPTAHVVLRDHREDLRRENVSSRKWSADGVSEELDPETIITARELGVSYPLRPFAGLATGLYVDQRGTRAWLRTQCRGKRVMNLFAYTGAFSLSLLIGGAQSGIDVDLSAPALSRATEAAELNGVSAQHHIIRSDCRQYLAQTTDEADIIICDPPTAAQGSDGWILRRDYPEILRLALTHLAPGGVLIACCNTIGGKPFPLRETVIAAAQEARVAGHEESGPDLASDIPQIHGFPEGRPYRLMAFRRD